MSVPKNHLTQARIQAFVFMLKGERVWMVVANFLDPFVFAALLMGQVMMSVQTFNKTNAILCSVPFYLTVEVFASILTKPEIYVK